MRFFYNSINSHAIGVDEVGRGAIAGPVVACASFINKKHIIDSLIIRDSKKLTAKKREEIYNAYIKNENHVFEIGIASVDEIDELNILNATYLAMQRAISNLNIRFDFATNNIKSVIIDGRDKLDNLPLPCEAIVKGDDKYIEIAISSIIAKVYRDHLMKDIGYEYTEYKFYKNAGYGTKEHFDAIGRFGFTKWHRKSILRSSNK